MKKRNLLLLSTFLIIILIIPLHGFAAEARINVLIDGKLTEFSNSVGYPFVDANGRTQVPFRITLEKFGAKVSWNQATSTAVAEKNGIKVEVPIGQKYILKNGQKIENDTAALIVGAKTYLPVRKVMEAFGCEVNWDAKTEKIEILSSKSQTAFLKTKVGDGVYYITPDILGESKLSDDELRKMKGNALEMRMKITTVAEFIRYLRINDFTTDGGDTKTFEGDYEWHHNRPSWSTIKLNKGNCGAIASLGNYILHGKYDEVGFITYSAFESGHVYNYIIQDSKIYIVDFLQYLDGNLSDYNRQTVIEEVDSFKQHALLHIKKYIPNVKYFVKYTADEVLPIANTKEKKMMYYQRGANVTSFYETPEIDFVLRFIDPPTKFPEWD